MKNLYEERGSIPELVKYLVVDTHIMASYGLLGQQEEGQ